MNEKQFERLKSELFPPFLKTEQRLALSKGQEINVDKINKRDKLDTQCYDV